MFTGVEGGKAAAGGPAVSAGVEGVGLWPKSNSEHALSHISAQAITKKMAFLERAFNLRIGLISCLAMVLDDTQKQRGWLLPQIKGAIAPGLHIVATPIGNLGDITLRALDVLAAADLIACEDTRVSGKLLSHFGIKCPLLSYNDHNAAQQRGPILERLKKGERVALISDAGTPLISDPGYKLIKLCVENNVAVTSLPGANAPLTALQLSGLPTDGFCFGGFLPPKSAARRKVLAGWKNVPATLIFFETAPRLQAALADILETLGDREIAIARELTKMYENVKRAKVSAAIEIYEKEGPPKGEIVLVIGGAQEQAFSEKDIDALLKKALRTMGTKEAAAYVGEITGHGRKELYDLALRISKK